MSKFNIKRGLWGALILASTGFMAGCPAGGGGTGLGGPNKNVVEYLYTTNRSTDNISIFQVDNVDGTLQLVGTAKAGSRPQCSQFTTDNYLYVGDAGDNNLWVYKVLSNGALQLRGKHAFPAPVSSLCISDLSGGTGGPIDALVGDTVHCFAINDVGSGDIIKELAAVKVGPGNKIGLFSQAKGVLDGYVADTAHNQVYPFQQHLSSTSSSISVKESPLLVGTPIGFASFFTQSDSSDHLVIGSGINPSGALLNFTRSTSSGIPTLIPTSNGVRTGKGVSAMASDLLHGYVFTLENGDDKIGQYAFDANSKLSKFSGTLASPGAGAQCLALGLGGGNNGNLYVGNAAGDVRHYRISDGTNAVAFVKTHASGGSDISSISFTDAFDKVSTTALQITATLANGKVGTAYEQALTTSGGRQGVLATWKITSGTLPAGLQLSEDSQGVWTLIGNPISAGTYTFTLEADEGEINATKSFTVDITTTGGTGITGKFINLDAQPADASLTFHLGSLTFPAAAFGKVTPAETVTTGTATYSTVNGAGTTVQNGSFILSAGINQFLFFQATDRAGSVAFLPSVPTAGQAGIEAIAVPPDFSSLDVFVLSGSSNTVVTFKLAATAPAGFSVPAGSYRVRFNEPGSTNVYATTPVFTIAAGKIEAAAATATLAGANRTAVAASL